MADSILVVDNDRRTTAFLDRFLSQQGFSVRSAGSAARMGGIMAHRDFDMVLLDIDLPDIDGFEVTRELRRSSRLPIILLTAREDVMDKVIGLELGADDYVSKPFEPRELLARIRSVLRRAKGPARPHGPLPEIRSIQFNGFVLDLAGRTLKDPERSEIDLTGMEFNLLRILAENAGRVVARESIMERLYGAGLNVTDRAIDAHVARLRKKLKGPARPDAIIRTVHGKGYSLAAEARCD